MRIAVYGILLLLILLVGGVLNFYFYAVPLWNDTTSKGSPPITVSTQPQTKPMPPIGDTAESLPEAPKADAANTHRPLLPDRSLLLEVMPDPTDAKKTKPVRLLIECYVCMRKGILEVLLCKKDTKEHEAILRTAVDAKLIHSALLAMGLNPGATAQFVNAKTGEPDYKPARGPSVTVLVHYSRGGQLLTHPAQEWIRDVKTKKPMSHDWVFAGSRFLQDPEQPTKAPYYAANNGEVIGISNFVDSMLDIPVNITQDNAELNFDIHTDKVPALQSKVWVILEPAKK
jgi:hypothetical protein